MIYLDTSFVVSLYSPDTHSATAAKLIATTRETWLLSSLTELETVNALELRVFRKEVLARQARASLRHFQQDLQGGVFQLQPLPEPAFERARKLSQKTTARLGTRTADLLHVAAAQELGAKGFFSFDERQRKAAQAEGLKINPLA